MPNHNAQAKKPPVVEEHADVDYELLVKQLNGGSELSTFQLLVNYPYNYSPSEAHRQCQLSAGVTLHV